MNQLKNFRAVTKMWLAFYAILLINSCRSNTSQQEQQFTFKPNVSINKSLQIKTDSAKYMIGLYLTSPLYRSKILVNDSGNSIMAYEFDSLVVNKIRRDTSIHGVRVYLGRHLEGQDSLYTLVAIPTDINGINATDSGFEWHKPCPPCSVMVNGRSVLVGNLPDASNPLKYHN